MASTMKKAGASTTKKLFAGQEVTFEFSSVTPLSVGDDPYSDTEAIRQHRNVVYQGGVQMNPIDTSGNRTIPHLNSAVTMDADLTDDDQGGDGQSMSIDEFGENATQFGNKLVRTGRQRKKLAARTKGGEFQARRKKRRLYFCCVSSEIDVYKLHDYFVGAGGTMNGWKFQVTADVLHLFRGGSESTTRTASANNGVDEFAQPVPNRYMPTGFDIPFSKEIDVDNFGGSSYTPSSMFRDPSKRRASDEIIPDATLGKFDGQLGVSSMAGRRDNGESKDDVYLRQSSSEVFVFEFGAVVFWGFPRGEEINFLKIIRMFVTKGYVGPEEFQDGVDDMAFVSVPDVDTITIANDVLNMPDDAPTKQRLAVSFAIAQSTILAIFESRVYKLIEDYKYIPEALAAYGKIHLSGRQLGKMIGDVFVIRHDVNLHTEILDTPDFFWKDGEKYAENYGLVMRYLEMSQRTEVLNKRLDMLRELLDVLQQQMENAHSVKLEMIVIWLIVIEVLLQAIAIGGESLGLWGAGARSHSHE